MKISLLSFAMVAFFSPISLASMDNSPLQYDFAEHSRGLAALGKKILSILIFLNFLQKQQKSRLQKTLKGSILIWLGVLNKPIFLDLK